MKKLYARYNHPAGPETDQKMFLEAEQKKFLRRCFFYEVASLKMGAFSTHLNLAGVPTPYTHLNSVAFDFYIVKDGKMVPHNIFEDPEFNQTLDR